MRTETRKVSRHRLSICYIPAFNAHCSHSKFTLIVRKSFALGKCIWSLYIWKDNDKDKFIRCPRQALKLYKISSCVHAASICCIVVGLKLNGLFIAALFQLQLMKCRVVNTKTHAQLPVVQPTPTDTQSPWTDLYFQTFRPAAGWEQTSPRLQVGEQPKM